MGTRAQAFTAKIKNLQELQLRLMQGVQPTANNDIPHALKYFTSTLLGVLRDVPGQPMVMMRSREKDTERLALFPSLDYKGLYLTLLECLDLIHLMPESVYDFGKAFLTTLCSLIPFLERELIDTLPYVVASTLLNFPASLVEDVVDVLCWNLFPFTLTNINFPLDNCPMEDVNNTKKGNYASNSTAAILMMVYQFAKDNSAIHRKITECIMSLKEDVAKDLLCVIAHGTPNARGPAANLLFYYWPSLNPTAYDRRTILSKYNTSSTWKPPACYNPACNGITNHGTANDAVKICLDHSVSLAHHPDIPPPSFYCNECYIVLIRKSNNAKAPEFYEDIHHPIVEVDTTCENKNCRSNEKMAVAWCFSCAFSYQGNRPMRLCNQCNKIRHNTRRGADHVVHACLTCPWEMEPETQNYLVKAVTGLLQEAVPYGSGQMRDQEETHRRTLQLLTMSHDDDNSEDPDDMDETTLNERRLLSRYGVWLLVGLCTPTPDTIPGTFGHMLSMLFQWFNATAYLPNDKTGTALEKLKSEYLPQWLTKVYKSHSEVFVNCVLPNPPDYAKIGGHWDIIATRTNHIKEGLVRFFCLIPFDVINLQVWNKAMSHWMEAINQEVPKAEIPELKSVFSKIFDPDMSPLGFDAKEMYQFISDRFKGTKVEVQRQALQWLQLLCLLNVQVPLEILFEMFNQGLERLHQGPMAEVANAEDLDEEDESIAAADGEKPKLIVEVRSGGCLDPDTICQQNRPRSPFSDAILESGEDLIQDHEQSREEIFLNCFNLMIDVLNGQLEVQAIELHSGIKGENPENIIALINKILATPWFTELSNGLEEVAYLNSMEENPEHNDDVSAIEALLTDMMQLIHATLKKLMVIEDQSDDKNDDHTTTIGPGDNDAKNALLKRGPGTGLGGFMAALSALQSTVEKPDKVESDDDSSDVGNDEDFEVKVEEYSVPLQLVYHLLVRNSELSDADMRFYMLDSVHLLAIQCEVLSSVSKSQKKFLHWCQESLLTGILWQLLESTHSQVAEVAVPLLMHSVGLPGGADVLWKALDTDFQSEDWRIRYEAVEKVTVVFRFLPEGVNAWKRNAAAVKSVLSHAFCCLIACIDDITPQISQQANLFLGTIHDAALKSILECLEYQFDNVPIDRPIILKRLYQLFNCMIDRKVLTWSFFQARFEQIINEVQNYNVHQKHLNESFMQTNNSSESPTKNSESSDATKMADKSKKRHPTESNSTIRSLSAHLKFPYKRTVSAPGGMGLSAKASNVSMPPTLSSSTGNHGPAITSSSRQQSVPILKNKISKEHLLSKQVSNVATVIDELEYINIAAKTVDIEEVDKETIHLLVSLFMQFLSHAEQASVVVDENSDKKDDTSSTAYGSGQAPPAGKASGKALQALYTLLGFNENERRFTTMPYRIRCTPAINSFMATLPQVLDNNFSIGRVILLNTILILQKIPFPPRYATTWQHAYTLMQEKYLFQGCGFSLWHLEPSMRKNWLTSVMVIAYKYRYGHDEELVGKKIEGLLRIVIHTLAAQFHVCDRFAKPISGVSMRSRDLSSLGGETDQNIPDNLDFGKGPMEEDPDPESNESSSESEEEQAEELKEAEKVKSPPKSLPSGWAMQRLPSGRILFVDNTNQVTTWIDPRTGKSSDGKTEEELGLVLESPQSPLSLMDIITVGSPVNLDSVVSESSSSSQVTTVTAPHKPSEERLLPIGPTRQVKAQVPTNPDSMQREGIVDRVWQIFGTMETHGEGGEMIPLIEEKVGDQKIQVVASIQKQDSLQSDIKETTECYIGTVTHIRNERSLKEHPEKESSTAAPVHATEKEPEKPAEKEKLTTHKKGSRKKRRRKMGVGSAPEHFIDESSKASSVCGGRVSKAGSKQHQQSSRMDSSASLFSCRDNPLIMKQSALRVGEESVGDRCTRCGMPIEEYSEDEIGLCLTILETFINEEPGLVAPLLPEILLTVSRIARHPQYSWELDSSSFIPSNSRSVARQFIRCVLHQLLGNGIFSMVFHMDIRGSHRYRFFNTVVQCLQDFNELNPSIPVATFFQEMNDRKSISAEYLQLSLPNLACYLSCVPFDQVKDWANVFLHSDQFLRRLWTMSSGSSTRGSASSAAAGNAETSVTTRMSLKGKDHQGASEDVLKLASQIDSLYDIFCAILRMPGIQNHRYVLEPISKLVSHSLQHFTVQYHTLVSVCHLCNKAFLKERDKLLVTRTAVFELISALKFKTVIPDTNFLVLTNLVLQDAGGAVIEDIQGLSYQQTGGVFNTGASDVMRNNSSDVLEFIADVHTLSKVKSTVKGMTIGVNEDTLGAILKASIAQFIALEISKSNSNSGSFGLATRSESRSINRFLPWLFSPPGNTAAQAPREFLDCVAHIRLLSWLLLGSVNHTLRFSTGNDIVVSQPIPLEASCHIADHIQVILAGFAELSKTSVVHMCSLFHAFILCQLWTVYLEQIISLQPNNIPSGKANEENGALLAGSILLDFWGKVTPGVLQLVSHSKVLAEMVNLHFLGLMEALLECQSTILAKLLPLWTPVFHAFGIQLPDHVRLRLQAIIDYKPTAMDPIEAHRRHLDVKATDFLKKWLKRMEFKIGQIEMQASNVTQFLSV